jgi:8-oxo-dGTP pyrophosphatase MutT (NUDIX family)
VGVLTQFLSSKKHLLRRPALSRFHTSSFRSQSNHDRVQVAAVCYILRGGEPEFLLVRTKNGQWTFPKGGVNEDETNAAAAAREAHEEAGVKGSTERVPFIAYRHCKPKRSTFHREVILVHAHLCSVKRLLVPSEEYRDPTWFSPSKAKRRLQKYRDSEFAAEVAGVIDRAAERILF